MWLDPPLTKRVQVEAITAMTTWAAHVVHSLALALWFRYPCGAMQGSMRYVPNERASTAEMQRLRREAWQCEGILTVRVDDINEELIHKILVSLGNQLYGTRQTRAAAKALTPLP